MITLFGGGPKFGLPELSPFVTKTEVQLKMLGIPYAKELARPDQSPKGQIPFLDDDGTRLADSYFIREHLEKKHGKDLDAHLDARQRAEAWAIERMLEDHLAPALRWTCLHFSFEGQSQRFQYEVRADRAGKGFELLAHGVSGENGRFVTIAQHGKIGDKGIEIGGVERR